MDFRRAAEAEAEVAFEVGGVQGTQVRLLPAAASPAARAGAAPITSPSGGPTPRARSCGGPGWWRARSGPPRVIDRFHLRWVYVRERGGALFEIATDGPGFAAAEPLSALGGRLALPPFLEPDRARIEAGLLRSGSRSSE